MNKDNSGAGWLIIIIFAMVVYIGLQQESILKLQEALSEANANIEEANTTINDLNSQIDDAQGNAWSDYKAMGDALDSLIGGGNTVDTVSDPTPTWLDI